MKYRVDLISLNCNAPSSSILYSIMTNYNQTSTTIINTDTFRTMWIDIEVHCFFCNGNDRNILTRFCIAFSTVGQQKWGAENPSESLPPRKKWQATWTPSSRVRFVTTRNPATWKCEFSSKWLESTMLTNTISFQGANTKHGNHFMQRLLGGVPDTYNLYPFLKCCVFQTFRWNICQVLFG